MKVRVASSRSGVVATLAIAGLASIGATAAKADMILEQEIVKHAVDNTLWTVRDGLLARGVPQAPPGRMRFTGEESDFDSRRPFEQSARHAFDALGYAKAPAMAASLPTWLYGFNAIGSVDQTLSNRVGTTASSGTVAFDVTKIGIFTASDALTFVATGTGIWAHTFGLDVNTAAGAGTLAYTNGGFSADFTTSATWSSPTAVNAGVIAPPASSSVAYTGNVQYKYDLPYKLYFEPTVGVTYTELYTANFGTKTGDSTELHAGGRVGAEVMWMGFKIQPQIAGQVFKNVQQSGVLAGAVPGLPLALAVSTDAGIGARGSGRVNVIWTPSFSTFLDFHGMGVAGTKTAGLPATQTYGSSAGLRYSW